MKEGSLSVVLGSEELYTYENANFASKKTVRIEDAMTSFQFTVDRTVLLTVKQNGKNIDILNAAGEVLKTAEGKQIEAGGPYQASQLWRRQHH